MTRYRAHLPLALWLLLAGVATGTAQEGIAFIPSAVPSAAKNRALLDAADLRILLPLGYRPAPPADEGRLNGRPGVVESRGYRRLVAGVERRLELALVAAVGGGYEFALTGGSGEAGSGVANEDLAQVYVRFEALVGKAKPVSGRGIDLGYEMYRLGNIEADRALSLLKAMGYSTVEFQERATASKNSEYEQIFDLIATGDKSLPVVVKVVNAAKTSLMEEETVSAQNRTAAAAARSSRGVEGAPGLGGSHLHGTTTGEPLERLLLVYDRNDPESLEKLVNLLTNLIDVAAEQIVIEALVIEVNTSQLRELGVELRGSQGSVQGSFEKSDKGVDLPFTFLFSRDGFSDFLDFRGKLQALTESGNAKVLSSPSVLVLNDRQARIQVGQQIPVVRSTTTVSTTTSSVEYFPVGIVLNLRPRINRERTEVTMQIETIISSISQSTTLSGAASQVAFAPIVDNRQVETYVRVANGTPFIIGGLLSTDQQSQKVGVPLVSSLPLIGKLFSREQVERGGREVIVVITPHIVPLEDRSFSYLIPKDSDLFDRFDTQLFRNAYRVRDDDVFDLKFIWKSPVLQGMLRRVEQEAQEDVLLQRQEPFRTLLAGGLPGEEVFVRRMISEIVADLEFDQLVDPQRIFFFAPAAGDQGSRDVDLLDAAGPALAAPRRAVVLSYDAQLIPKPGRVFSLPVATVRDTLVDDARALLAGENRFDAEGNPEQYAIVLAEPEDLARLRQALVLKQVLELNKDLAQSLQAFRPGVQILFPTREDMRKRYHLVDREVAQLFYETEFYYESAERGFNRTLSQVERVLGSSAAPGGQTR